MKKFICFLLLIALFGSCRVFYNDLERLLPMGEIIAIKAVTDGINNDGNGIYCGDKKIVDVDTKQDLCALNYESITFVFDNKDINIVRYINKNNIHIDRMYKVGDNIVYDCMYEFTNVKNQISVQIVDCKDVILVGIPTVAEGF